MVSLISWTIKKGTLIQNWINSSKPLKQLKESYLINNNCNHVSYKLLEFPRYGHLRMAILKYKMIYETLKDQAENPLKE